MRIIGDIPHPQFKITLLHHQSKYTIQIEEAMLSQSYTIRESEQYNSKEEIIKLLDEAFFIKLDSVFKSMRTNWEAQLISSQDDIEFDTII